MGGRGRSRLDRALEFGYKDVSAVPVFLYHDTQQYFAQAYAMKVAGVAAGADTGELLLLRHRLAAAPRPCLFSEARLPSSPAAGKRRRPSSS